MPSILQALAARGTQLNTKGRILNATAHDVAALLARDEQPRLEQQRDPPARVVAPLVAFADDMAVGALAKKPVLTLNTIERDAQRGFPGQLTPPPIYQNGLLAGDEDVRLHGATKKLDKSLPRRLQLGCWQVAELEHKAAKAGVLGMVAKYELLILTESSACDETDRNRADITLRAAKRRALEGEPSVARHCAATMKHPPRESLK